jgi:hypothetical protein
LAVGAWLSNAITPPARAQLAITELMASATTNCDGITGVHPDFWELTNFGDDPIDLSGYRFWETGAVPFESANVLSNKMQAGESVIYVQDPHAPSEEAAAAAFRAWWGEANLSPNLQIRLFRTPRFDQASGEGVRLWDPNTNLMDEVFFGPSELYAGVTFISDPITGEFGVKSRLGACVAFRAVNCADVGSPGTNGCGRIPLSIARQPESQTVDAGTDVTLSVWAWGLPRPRGYQWYFNGTPLPRAPLLSDMTPVVVSYAGCGLGWRTSPKPNELRIPNVHPSHAGQYFVVFSNGLERLTSTVATLTVNTPVTPPRIECAPTEWWFPPLPGQRQRNLVLSPLQTATFDVFVRAYPPPSFRWSWSADGRTFTDLPEPWATNRTLVLFPALPSDAGVYRVRVWNMNGTNYAEATLAVQPKPALRITEAMSWSCRGTGLDWWELTNTGDDGVNVTGYRWDEDDPGEIGGGPTITNAVLIQPGESVILLESQTRELFIQSWGAENLPPNLQFIVYAANGLSEDGDALKIWNQSATDRMDFIDEVSFTTATEGTSFWFDPEVCEGSEFGVKSKAGQGGAFRAGNGCDVGSPGWTRWTPPRMTSIRRVAASVALEWKAQPGSLNRLQFARQLASAPAATIWTDLGTYTFAGATGTATDDSLGNDPQRFYRVVPVTPADYSCPE